MKNKNIYAVFLSIFAGAGGVGEAHAQSADQPKLHELEEVVVTARRREESLQDVPVSVTAFTPDMMKSKGISQPYDLIGNVPGLTVQGGGAGRNDVQFWIRGQGQTFGNSPSVVQYFAEVPVNPDVLAGGTAVTYYDLESLEVLKGPQGTLFGRPTTGGAVLVNPKKPSHEFDGFVETEFGNYASRDITAAINVPLIDNVLAVRIAANSTQHDGYSKSYITGQELDDRNRDSYRVGVLFEPAEWVSSYTLFQDNKIDESSAAVTLAYLDENHDLMDTTPTGVGYLTVAGICGFIGGGADCIADRVGRIDAVRNGLIAERDRLAAGGDDAVRRAAHSQINFVRSHTQLLTNITEFQLGNWGFLGDTTLKNVFSTNRSLESASVDEIAGSPVPHGVAYQLVDIRNFEAKAVESSDFGRSDWMDAYSEEIQLSGTAADKHPWVLGYFYERNKNQYTYNKPTTFTVFDGAFTVPAGLPGVSSNFADDYELQNTGIYGQTTLDLADIYLEDFKLTLGYRYIEFEEQVVDAQAMIGADGIQRVPGGSELPADVKQTEGTYTIALDWQATDDLLIYATHRRGFKQGGINIQSLEPATMGAVASNPYFEPEVVKDYELGAKWDWSIGDIYGRTNATAFFSKYSDLQRNETFQYNASVVTQIRNIAKAKNQGLELENVFRLTDNLQLDLSYSYLHAEFTKWPGTDLNNLDQPVERVDIPVTGAPRHIVGALLQYWLPMVPVEAGTVKTSLSYTFQDRVILGDGSQYNAEDESVDPYSLINVRLDWENVMGNPVDLGFFVRNVTDEVYPISNSGLFQPLGQVGRIYGDPRTYGFEIRARFGASAG